MLRLLTNDEIRLLTREELEKYVAVIHRYVEITEIRRVHNLFKSDIEKNGTNEEVAASSAADLLMSDMEARMQNIIAELRRKALTYYGPRNEENDR